MRILGLYNDLTTDLILELAKSGRSGCQTKECKDEKVKIQKGELRLGSWVDTDARQFWTWRHW